MAAPKQPAGNAGKGRAPGSKNKRTIAREQATAQAAAKISGALGRAAFKGDAHAFLMAVYKDKNQPLDLRLDAAKAAVGYEKPRLASVEAKLGGEVRHVISAEPLTDDEWESQYGGAGDMAPAAGPAKGAH